MQKKIIDIQLSNDPIILARTVLPHQEITDKNKKQFITSVPSSLTTIFDDGSCFTLYARAKYIYDGATIPFGIGKGDMRLLIPALFHDLMCEDKSLVNYDRRLSSEIFKETLISCGVSEVQAKVMSTIVDIYQIPLFIYARVKKWIKSK